MLKIENRGGKKNKAIDYLLLILCFYFSINLTACSGSDNKKISTKLTSENKMNKEIMPLGDTSSSTASPSNNRLDGCDLSIVPEMDSTSFGACYRVTFTTKWSNVVFGAIPDGAHFTSIAGAIVNEGAKLWELGALTSDGLEVLAETGVTRSFISEINQAISRGEALTSFTTRESATEDSLEFIIQLNRTYPQVTWASMVAPTPDWFLGQSNFTLLDEKGEWINEIELDLNVYDAGTENGSSFSLAGENTSPAELISRLKHLVEERLQFEAGNLNGQHLASIKYERIR